MAEKKPKVSYSEGVKVALYAKNGGRKTLQIGHLIEEFGAENVLVVNCERGLRTIESKLTVKDNVILAPSLKELRNAFPKVQAFATGLDKFICLDGGSRVVQWMANEQLNGADRYYEAMKKGTTAALATEDLQYGRFIQKGEINSMAVYNKVGRDSETIWNAWVSLNANVYVNFWEELVGTSGFEKTFPYGPDVPGKVGLTAVTSAFDFVGRLFYHEQRGLVGGFDVTSYQYMAKTRDDWDVLRLPAEIDNFNLARFVRLVNGEITEEELKAGKANVQ
jgi:hypothetical protein